MQQSAPRELGFTASASLYAPPLRQKTFPLRVISYVWGCCLGQKLSGERTWLNCFCVYSIYKVWLYSSIFFLYFRIRPCNINIFIHLSIFSRFLFATVKIGGATSRHHSYSGCRAHCAPEWGAPLLHRAVPLQFSLLLEGFALGSWQPEYDVRASLSCIIPHCHYNI